MKVFNLEFNLEKARKHYEEIKDNPIYCTKTETENTGGNFMVTEVPCTYQGMDCFLSYGWACPEVGVMLFMNHYLDKECDDCPYYRDECLMEEIDVFSDEITELSDAFAQMRAEIEKWTEWVDGEREFAFDKYYYNW